ncbi:MAG: desulfoferrodoxin [Methanomassiliicoccus sp.]|nr:desulfoferrodoxin [Methanomassiliicoccus sp.]
MRGILGRLDMTKMNEVYKCPVCGNIVEVAHAGVGELVCCGKPMVKLASNTVEASYEKHIPVVERIDGGIRVKVGSVPHPMEEKHYIEFIEVIADGQIMRKHLKPGMKPEAEFRCAPTKFCVRELCNIHGMWKFEPE